MQFTLRILVVAVLAWQGVCAGWALLGPVVTQGNKSWHQKLLATSDERLRQALGKDAATLFAMRAAAEPSALWLAEKVGGRIEDIKSAEDFERLSARNGLLIQLTTLSYPDPFLLTVANAIASTEDVSSRGQDAVLCVFPGDASPSARVGWSLVKRNDFFELWRFQKG